MSKRENDYPVYTKCELITADSPVFVEEVYKQLNRLQSSDFEEVGGLAMQAAQGDSDIHSKDPISLEELLVGLTQLTTLGVVEITEIVEAIHAEMVLRPLGRFDKQHLNKWQKGVNRRLYDLARHSITFIGDNVSNTGFEIYRKSKLAKMLHSSRPLPDALKSLVNILNGLIGDHLVTQHNPMAVPMMLYDRYGQPQRGQLSGRVIIICHGLCLSYLSWHPCDNASLGERIMTACPKGTILYLDYNTGRRISQNGQHLAQLIQALLDNSPEITQIDLIGYSMGGLVCRSALYYAEQYALAWINHARNLITIGTPHQGAGLERISHYVLDTVKDIPFAGSLSKMGDVRSAGIIDLRHGSIREEDWVNLDKRDVLSDTFRYPSKLPRHVRAFFIAGSLVEGLYDSKTSELVGDGLVTVASALGESHGAHGLWAPDGHKAVFYGINHRNLLYAARVHCQVVRWLEDNGQTDYALKMRIESFPYDSFHL